MKFGYTIIYVSDVKSTMDFYEKAFGFQTKFLDESNRYGELETRTTVLAFVAESMATVNGYEITQNTLQAPAAGIEIAFISDDVEKSYTHALEAGCVPIKSPEAKPWGQVVAYVRDMNGVLVEICSPIG
jgi:predicted enzyme related to lactoylglutathione lyase